MADECIDLSGCKVLVTRPASQADGLCRSIEDCGGVALRCPALEIVSSVGLAAAQQRLTGLTDGGVAVFVSINAVRYSGLGDSVQLPPGVQIAAIGDATAAAVRSAGYEPRWVARGVGSEALLEEPDWRQPTFNRAVIVRGEGGRELLASALAERSVDVHYAEVYRRAAPSGLAGALNALRSSGWVNILTVTSVECLLNVWEAFNPLRREQLLETPLVGLSSRITAVAEARGWGVVASSVEASDAGLVVAVAKLFERVKLTQCSAA